jgi:diaminopimelate decarboxylase
VLYGSGYEAFLPRAPFAADRDGGSGWSASTARAATCCCSKRGCRRRGGRRPARHAGHRRVRPVDGLQLQPITRPPVVFVRDGDARVVVRRETYDDLLATDMG